jgi:hypothetical protein
LNETVEDLLGHGEAVDVLDAGGIQGRRVVSERASLHGGLGGPRRPVIGNGERDWADEEKRQEQAEERQAASACPSLDRLTP